MKRFLAIFLCALTIEIPAYPQQQVASIEPIRPNSNIIIRPYQAVDVPPVRLANSPRLRELVRAGTLYLTAQDAIALALENNIDLEVARYNPIMATWRVERSEAGGLLPGVPSNASQAGSVAAGQGVSGSQAAAGVSAPGSGRNTGGTTNATVSQIGPVTQTLDPIFQEASTFSHTSTPQANSVQSSVQNLISNTRAHQGSYQQGFLSGGSVTVRYTNNYLNENSPTNVLNPSTAGNLQIAAQHNLFRGFGIAMNARTITVSKMNAAISDLQFRSQVINVVTQVLNVYYGLAGDYETLKARQETERVADTFLANVRRQIEEGNVAPPEAINAERQLVNSRQDVVDAEATLRQREIRLKSFISRSGTADPLLAGVRVIPVDPIVMPGSDNLPALDELVRRARTNRPDLLVEQQSDQASVVSALGTRNGILPSAQVFGAINHAGLAGTAQPVQGPGGQVTYPDPYFVGGTGDVLGQIFRRNFPTERIGGFIAVPIRNRQAQADYNIDQLQLVQGDLSTRKAMNQVEVDVMNYMIALQQARARYQASVQNRVLQEQLYSAEQKKYAAGASTPYNVIQIQRDVVSAKAAELSSLVTYNSARIALDQTTGDTLDANHVSITEARDAKVARVSTPPPAPK
jgi:outer membrane protein TolC